MLDSIKSIFQSKSRSVDDAADTDPDEVATGRTLRQPRRAEVAAPKAPADLLQKGLTWKALKSKETTSALRKSEANALALARTLPNKYDQTRSALFSYASGIRFVLGSAEKNMDATQAIRFLEELDAEVYAKIRHEGLSASDFNAWSRVSLGSLFRESKSLRYNQIRQMPFNPQLRLVSVRVSQPGTKARKWIENGRAYVSFAGVVVGRDIARIQLYRNGDLVASRVPRRPNRFEQRFFKYTGGNARGVWTIKVLEKGGQTYEKSYSFYAPARSFAWLPRKRGTFAIPFYAYDPRIDMLFTYSSGERNRGFGSFFSNSVGDGFAKF